MRKLLVVLLLATTAFANETAYKALQSGLLQSGTPVHDHGIHGEGQIIAILDTGLDWQSCFFSEPNGSAPPFNTWSASTGLQWQNIDLTRRKVIAYDLLWSCDQYPGAPGCETPTQTTPFDNQGHGTHAAGSAAGDSKTPIVHDFGDAVAPAAKLVIQDAGFIGGDTCSQRPGIGCPVNLTPILDQAYKQGVRIHSNSWGDAQGSAINPPTANYSQSARDVDAFVYAHPDMLVLFNTGNWGLPGNPPASTLSAPGAAKNTLQVGGTRDTGRDDDTLARYTLNGPTRDGRLKPEIVAPSIVIAGDAKVVLDPLPGIKDKSCGTTVQPGTSWSSPEAAGAAALARQYYTDGFYPTGAAVPANAMTPSAALLKATLISSARRVPFRWTDQGADTAQPTPSYEQGFGMPALDDALYFPGDLRRLRVADVTTANGLTVGETATIKLDVKPGTPLRAVLVWTDPPGVVAGVSNSTPQLVNDLDLRVTPPAGSAVNGNDSLHPGQPDRLNNTEVVTVAQPVTGTYTIEVNAQKLGQGPRQGYALVLTGDFTEIVAAPRPGKIRAIRPR
ncbi:MAG: S8 family serine peptidase [Acidobacteria bacterium]|nr:S8 family serine peptidase [Acidobacteriota bacterium]